MRRDQEMRMTRRLRPGDEEETGDEGDQKKRKNKRFYPANWDQQEIET